MPATTILPAPRPFSRPIALSISVRQSRNERSYMRRCDQHILGRIDQVSRTLQCYRAAEDRRCNRTANEPSADYIALSKKNAAG
jgi:hypothetical protein